MAAFPEQDRKAGLSRTRQYGRQVTAFDEKAEKIAYEMVHAIANGALLKDLCEIEGYPSQPTFRRWLSENTDLHQSYMRAREASAGGIEEQIAEISLKLAKGEIDKEHVQGVSKGLDNLWKLARVRFPARYSDKPDTTQAVQVNIITPFNLEPGASAEVVEQENLYKATLTLAQPEQAAADG